MPCKPQSFPAPALAPDSTASSTFNPQTFQKRIVFRRYNSVSYHSQESDWRERESRHPYFSGPSCYDKQHQSRVTFTEAPFRYLVTERRRKQSNAEFEMRAGGKPELPFRAAHSSGITKLIRFTLYRIMARRQAVRKSNYTKG